MEGQRWRLAREPRPYLGGATHATPNQWINGVGPISTPTGPDEGLATAQVVYQGGHEHTISEAAATELVAAGYSFEWEHLTTWTHDWEAPNSRVEDGRAVFISDPVAAAHDPHARRLPAPRRRPRYLRPAARPDLPAVLAPGSAAGPRW